MRLASMEPMKAVPVSERSLKADEVKPRGTEDPRALMQTEASQEGEGAPQKQKTPDEGFVRFVEFIKRQGKRNPQKKPKTRKERMIAAYRELEAHAEMKLSRGGKFDKAG